MTNWAHKPIGSFPAQFFSAIQTDLGGELGFGLQHRSPDSVRNQWFQFLKQLRSIPDHPYHERAKKKWRLKRAVSPLHAGEWRYRVNLQSTAQPPHSYK